MFRARAALAAVGAAAFLAAGVPAAHAVEGQAPTVRWASSVSEDLGTLQVSIGSDSAVTDIRAHIVSTVTQQEVAVVEHDAFVLASGATDDGVWRTARPLSLPAWGSYSVRVEATDADGDRTTEDSAGTLAYYVQAVFEDVRTDRAEVGTDDRQVRVDGVLKGRRPDTRELEPLADHPVDIDVDYWTEATPRTDAEGRFSSTVTVNYATQIQAVFRHAAEHPYVLYGESSAMPVGIRQVATRWVVQSPADGLTIDLGQSVTLTATLERETPQGWAPFAGQSGGILFEPSAGGQSDGVGGFTTGEDGRITLTYTPREAGTFLLTTRSEDPFVAPAQTSSPQVTVLRSSVFTRFSAIRTEDRGVRVEGGMDFPDGWTPGTVAVRVQYSRDGGTWTDVTTVEAYWSGRDHGFSADVADAKPGWFRARFDATGPFRAATSDAVKPAR
ncbi:hypothetical protein [Streptomyces sp. NK15101]|uniref:hypothetical protein n=1 Tax=Streptomyces sp. NK15101 TaxID=2873261 RepID=UPI001CEC72BD|nr:hypothetical protein [Streptomyces sp. NK15101]